jgi:hypothetical protein
MICLFGLQLLHSATALLGQMEHSVIWSQVIIYPAIPAILSEWLDGVATVIATL